MDIKYDVAAASQLLHQMDRYCSEIQKQARELLYVDGGSGEWDDKQTKAFHNNITVICKDLNTILSLESNYMEIFYQRIMELRG